MSDLHTKAPAFRTRRRDLLAWMGALPFAAGLPAGSAWASMAAADEGDPEIRAAFFYAFTLYEFARTEQTLARCLHQPGVINRITTRNKLSDYTARTVTAPNNDTIYSSAFLDLSAGPVEVIAPTVPTRYFSIQFMDAFTDNFAYVGTRATDGKGGRFWVVGPHWEGTTPPGVTLFRSTTNDVWMLVRILVDGPDDVEAAAAIQRQFAVIVPPDRAPARGFTNEAVRDVRDPRNFLAVVNEMLARSPGGNGQLARATRFAQLGIGSPQEPAPSILDRWAAYFPIGLKTLREAFLFRDLVSGGWTYQPRGVGNFGTNDRLRAAIALGGIAALGEQEAMYFHASLDPAGRPLSGLDAYRWRIPAAGIPVKGFWSLTMYDVEPDGRYFLVQNPINRYSIGDRTPGLVHAPDGSLEIVIQSERPKGPLAANWLPAPAGPMRLALRAYYPQAALIERQWRVPPLVRAQPL